jgi:hypothetical protein
MTESNRLFVNLHTVIIAPRFQGAHVAAIAKKTCLMSQ